MDARSILLMSRAREPAWHPFDTAWGTLALGLLLTGVLVAVLRIISG